MDTTELRRLEKQLEGKHRETEAARDALKKAEAAARTNTVLLTRELRMEATKEERENLLNAEKAEMQVKRLIAIENEKVEDEKLRAASRDRFRAA